MLALPAVESGLARMAAEVEGRARILVRPSGTESLMRVMVEAEEEALLDATMAEIILLIQDESKNIT